MTIAGGPKDAPSMTIASGPKAALSNTNQGDVRGSNPPPWIHIPPSSQTSNVTINGAGVRRWAAVESHHVLPLFRRTLLLN